MHPSTSAIDERRARLPREHQESIIVGAGQAGLTVAYHLGRAGRPAVVLHTDARVGDQWRRHWDSLRLYTPAKYCGLPGLSLPGDPSRFATKDEVADMLEAYVSSYDLDVRGGVAVQTLTRDEDGFRVLTAEREYLADNVVVATGTFGPPFRPGFAVDLAPAIRQLHSSEYRRPTDLQPGPVLVVGASHSGADIAVEVAQSHRTLLCGPSRGQIPFALEGRAVRALLPFLWFVAGTVLHVRTPIGRKARGEARTHGGPLLRYRDVDLVAAGVEWSRERVVGVEAGRPVLESGRVAEVTNVVWCTGFRQDLSWIELPVMGDDGWPREHRGVVDSEPGLYFNGLAFQSSFRSMLVGGAGDDARFVVKHLVARQAAGAAARRRSPTTA